MANRLDQTFQNLRADKKKAFIAYLTAGDPNLTVTRQLVLALETSGADIIELGVPYSDPLADGPVIQEASQRALKHQVDIPKILESVKQIRRHSDIPICLMTYYNPVFHYGESKFVKDAVRAGVDGVIIPDLPPEEAKTLIQQARKCDLATVFFLSPTTTLKRAQLICKHSTGFVYYVSLAGVTGSQKGLSKGFRKHIQQIKRFTNKPICVGFGISSREDVKAVNRVADGAIVGSAIIKEICRHKNKKTLVQNVARFVAKLNS